MVCVNGTPPNSWIPRPAIPPFHPHQHRIFGRVVKKLDAEGNFDPPDGFIECKFTDLPTLPLCRRGVLVAYEANSNPLRDYEKEDVSYVLFFLPAAKINIPFLLKP
jgi:hypothetical protein